jgi:hypothetical protein
VSILPRGKCGSSCAAAASNAGAIWRQGPHQPAQKSTSSGMSLALACFSKFNAVSVVVERFLTERGRAESSDHDVAVTSAAG